MKRILISITALFCLLTACAIPDNNPLGMQDSSVSESKESEVNEADAEDTPPDIQDSSISEPAEDEVNETVPESAIPNIQESTTPESTESKVYEIVPEGTPRDEFADYASIIAEYRRFAGYAIEFDNDEYYKQVDDLDTWIDRGWMGWLIASNYCRERTKEDFSYAVHDLNGNGSLELILFMGDSSVCAIFSMVDGKPKCLDYFWDRYCCEVDSTGMLCIRNSGGATLTDYASYRISKDDEELLLIDEFGTFGYDMATLETLYYKMVNGIKQDITSTEFDELENQFYDASHLTKNSGIEIIPLFD